MSVSSIKSANNDQSFRTERQDLACALRWAVRLNMHEAVANHFSLAVNEDGSQFLMNPNQRHFSLVRASDLLLVDANDSKTMEGPDAPDPTAWGLHGSVHRHCRHARCVLHAHPIYSTVLASLADSALLPIDQNCTTFYGRYVVDQDFDGLAFESEGERCATLLADPNIQVMIMGNHGVLVLGDSVADAFNRLYYFERAAETYVKALWTGKELRVLSDAVATKVSTQLADYPSQADRHFSDLREILDREGSDFRD
jgi:ribulose-5-phosphate 4-epimerase/fuculose-1-phosphate aldolase